MAKPNPLTRLLDAIQLATSKRLNKRTAAMHIWMYRRTGGLVGGRIRGLPVLLLTTTGRKSGQQRTSPLSYLTDGPNYVVIASNSGRPNYPAWFLNLQSDPHATVQVGRNTRNVTARVATPEERAKLWAELTRKARNYADYEKMTTREIPMVVLEPAEQPNWVRKL